MVEAFLTSTSLVALAEVGDKTQLLAFALAARFRRPAPIIAAIAIATLANHALAASLGVWIAGFFTPQTLRWTVGLAFLGFGAWTLIPDRPGALPASSRTGVFLTTLIAFFLAEMGDKTQFATIALAARFHAPVIVTVGTTVGMLLANVPAVLLGERLAGRLSFKAIRRLAAALFFVTGLVTLWMA